MKASELITKLQKLVREHGDLTVKDHQNKEVHTTTTAKVMDKDFNIIIEHFNIY